MDLTHIFTNGIQIKTHGSTATYLVGNKTVKLTQEQVGAFVGNARKQDYAEGNKAAALQQACSLYQKLTR